MFFSFASTATRSASWSAAIRRRVFPAMSRGRTQAAGQRPAELVRVFVSRPSPVDAATSPYLVSRFRANPVFGEKVSWEANGVEPRWLGQETSDCAAAFDPSVFHNHGVDELRRFLAGAHARRETALLIATIGDLADDSPRSVMQTYDSSVNLPDLC